MHKSCSWQGGAIPALYPAPASVSDKTCLKKCQLFTAGMVPAPILSPHYRNYMGSGFEDGYYKSWSLPSDMCPKPVVITDFQLLVIHSLLQPEFTLLCLTMEH